MYRKTCAVFSVCIACQALANSDDLLQVLDQENQVYAASRYVQSLDDTPASVSVQNRDDLLRFAYYSLDQALLSFPGVHNAANLAWPMYGIRGIAKPGDICSRFATLINGMPAVYDPVFGGTCFHQLDIESLKRVEMVRGPGSSVYGSGAVLGAFNLVTEDAVERPGLRLSLKGASSREGHAYASYGGEAGPLNLFMSISTKYRTGLDYYFPEYDQAPLTNGWSRGNDGQRQHRFFSRMQYQHTWVQARIEQNIKNDPQAAFGTVFDTRELRYDDRSLALEAGHSYKLHQGDILSRVYYSRFLENGNYPYNTTGAQGFVESLFTDNIDSQQFGGELRLDTFAGDSHHVLTGIDVRYASGRQFGGTAGQAPDHDFREKYGLVSLYTQDEAALGNGRVTAGARYDYYHSYSPTVHGRLNPRLAYVHRLAENTSGKLVYAEAFRVPTQYEIFYTDNATKFDNLTLVPEVMRTLEAIVEHNFPSAGRLSVSLYTTRLEDAIVLDPNCSGCAKYINLSGYQQVQGVEASWSLRTNAGLRAYASATSQSSGQQPANAEMAASPRVLAKGGISVPANWHHAYAGTELQYTGGTQGMIYNGSRLTAAPAYSRCNVFFAMPLFTKAWAVSLRVDNLFDQPGYITQPASYSPLQRTPVGGRTASLRISRAMN